MTKPKPLKTDFRSHDRWLSFTFVVGPLAVLGNVATSYILAPESCTRGSKLILHMSALAFFLIALSGAVIARWVGARVPDVELPDLRDRIRWLFNASVVLALGSAVAVIGTEIPNLILWSCD
jgi:hypothetical protein